MGSMLHLLYRRLCDEGVGSHGFCLGREYPFFRQHAVRLGSVTMPLIECDSRVFEQTYQLNRDQAYSPGKITVFDYRLG